MLGCGDDDDIIVYRRSPMLGWFCALYRKYTYTRLYLHDGGAWMCNESYMLVPKFLNSL